MRILIVGYFGYENGQIDGQTIKTRSVYELISTALPECTLDYYDTQAFQNNKVSILSLLKALWYTDVLVYLPGLRNLTLLFPIIHLICRLRAISMVNIVVGGWLAEFLSARPNFQSKFKSFDSILVETRGLENILQEKFNLTNVKQFPNFRIQDFTPKPVASETFRIVFMARVTMLKGIKSLLDYAEYILQQKEGVLRPMIIDFYGPIDSEIKEWFLEEIAKYQFVSYKGVTEPSLVHEVLQNYDVLVLPTKYPGEGFPGTVVDAYISGIPVIVSEWKYLPEAVLPGKTGFIYSLDRPFDLFNYLNLLSKDHALLSLMKKHAIESSRDYSKEKALTILVPILNKIKEKKPQ